MVLIRWIMSSSSFTLDLPEDQSSSMSTSSTGPFGLDRSNSASSTAGPFAYQTRLLERTSSRNGPNSLARNNSLSSNSTGSTSAIVSTPTATRRWTPSHRVGNSVDSVRGKWEERVRAENEDMPPPPPPPKSPTKASSSLPDISENGSRSREIEDSQPQLKRTPAALKRHTLPAHISTSPLSPNNTGMTIEGDDYASSPPTPLTTLTPQRIRLPTSLSFQSSTSTKPTDDHTTPTTTPSSQPLPISSSTIGIPTSSWCDTSKSADPSLLSSNASSRPKYLPPIPPSYTPISRRPTPLYGSVPSSPEKSNNLSSSLSRFEQDSTDPSSQPYTSPLTPSPTKTFTASSIMSPTPYRSSYMAKKTKKTPSYGNDLSIGRKLGRHLPRIASGDADEDWVEERKEDTDRRRRREVREKERERRTRALEEHNEKPAPVPIPTSPRKPLASLAIASTGTGVTDTDDVAGIPGRLRLSKDHSPNIPDSPLPSARLGRLWADTKRQHLQAYEYLCHVGEAQQWIEGCLGEELGFGVVEMEEGLRNGVVLAKLVRAFQGEKVVRRIYEVCLT